MGRWNRTPEATGEEYSAVKETIGNAFKALRRKGYIARQNFLCCGSCASSQIFEDFKVSEAKKPGKLKGAVYFHRQDNDGLTEGAYTYLGHGPLDLDETERDADRLAVGKEIVAALEEAALPGVRVIWNGDPATRILVEHEGPGIRKAAREATQKVLAELEADLIAGCDPVNLAALIEANAGQPGYPEGAHAGFELLNRAMREATYTLRYRQPKAA